MSKKVTVHSFEEAAEYLEKYKAELKRKAELVVESMLKSGEDYAINAMGHIDTGETISSLMGYRKGNRGILLVGGNAIWLEFGTGVIANDYASYPHPRAQNLGMRAIGTYGEGHGSDPNGWFYYNEERGQVEHTYGITATRFFYNTAQMLRREYPKLAKEIFD